MSYKKGLKKAGKITAYILGSVVILLCLLLLFINTSTGKRMVKNKVESYLRDKLKTTVRIGSIDYSLPSRVELRNIYIEDRQKDTLLYGEELAVNINLVKLAMGNTDIKKVSLKNIFAGISRAEKDSNFNFQFILDAFTGNNPSTKIRDTAEMKLSLDRFILDNISLRYDDKYAGTMMFARVKELDASLNTFKPDRLNFGINDFTGSGIDFTMTTYKVNDIDSVKAVVVDTTTGRQYGLYITANNFNIRDVNVMVENNISGMYYANNITSLGLKNVLFDLTNARATGEALKLDSSRIRFRTGKSNPPNKDPQTNETNTDTSSWFITAKEVSLKDNQFSFDDSNKPQAGGFDVSHMNAKNIFASIAGFVFAKDSIQALANQLSFIDSSSGFRLDSTHIGFLMTDKILAAKDLFIKTQNSVLQNSFSLSYDSIAGIMKHPANTLIAANLHDCTIGFNDLYLLSPALKTSFPPASFQNSYVHFNTEIRGNLERIYLPSLQLVALSGSMLNGSATLFNLTDANKFYYDLFIHNSSFKKSDILKFVPPENMEAMNKLPDIINLRGHITGNRTNLTSDVQVRGKGLFLDGKFLLSNISNPSKLQYGFALRNSSFSRDVVMGFIPPGTLPPNIQLPPDLSAKGSFKGDANNFTADLLLGGSYGSMKVKGYMKNIKDTSRVNYDLLISTDGFEIGKLIGQDSILGKVAGDFKAKGTGFNYKTMRSSIDATVKQLEYNHYNYHNADITANFNNGIIDTKGTVNDSSLRMNYDLSLNVKGPYPSVNGFVRIDTAQLQKLNLYKDTLNFSLTANIKADNVQPRHLDINTVIDSIRLQKDSKFYSLDSVSLLATSENGVDNIQFNSPFADLQANGAFDYDKIGIAVMNYIDHYYDIIPAKDAANIADQQISFNGTIKKHPLVTDVVPGLTDYSDIPFKGSFASADTDSALNFNAAIPYLVYNGDRISNAAIDVHSRNERIAYAVNFDTLNYSSNTFYGTRVSGSAANDSLVISGITQDDNNKDWFGLNASLFTKDNVYSFRLKDTLLLNYERWNVSNDNYIRYSPEGLIIHNFSINSDTARISLNSRQEIPNSPIDVSIDNFNLKSISAVFNKDTLLVAGILDAKLEVSELDKKLPAFNGDLTIASLEVKGVSLGELKAAASKQPNDVITANISLQGINNDIEAKGNYYVNNAQQDIDATLHIKRLNMALIQGLSMGEIRNATGNIHGDVVISGKVADPKWDGELNFDTVRFTPTQLGAPFKINKQQVEVKYPYINLRDFTILDSLDHKMELTGTVRYDETKQIIVDLGIDTKDFIIMNTARPPEGSDFYGYASIDAGIDVTGTFAAPDIQGNVSLNEKSDVTIVIPERSYTKDEGKTIVRFIDRDTFELNPPVVLFRPEKDTVSAFAKFLNYNLNIDVDRDASLTIVIDPSTGDEIKVKGSAQLNAGVDPGGNLVLSGNYELNEGYYVFNYQFLQRKFRLLKGGSIVFLGEPTAARIDITAEYDVNTSARDLIGNEVGSIDPGLASSFNQKVPFKVLLHITGVISKPVIKFDIQLPEDVSLINSDLRTTIENKLAQIRSDESATNKQVFSLLLMGRFVGEQSSDFFKGNGSDFNDLARQSVSQFLSSALNEIAGDIFKGIDIDLNLNSYHDYTTGGSAQRTDLNVVLSKTFLDDRLTVSVGKNFGLEGQDAAAKASQNSNYLPDITISYKLTKDGKYRIRAYRKNQFEVVMDGYVVETGLGFVVTMDYNKFSELFGQRRKRRAAKP